MDVFEAKRLDLEYSLTWRLIFGRIHSSQRLEFFAAPGKDSVMETLQQPVANPERAMPANQRFLEPAFEPEATQAMSVAFEDVCRALNLPDAAERERAAVAVRIVELARRGERDPHRLRDRVLREAGAAGAD
jgi:hypothetical protein